MPMVLRFLRPGGNGFERPGQDEDITAIADFFLDDPFRFFDFSQTFFFVYERKIAVTDGVRANGDIA